MKWWPILQYLFGAYFILLGVFEAWDNWELYPWFIIVMFGMVLIMDAWTMKVHRDTIDLYKESIVLLNDVIEKQGAQIIEMHKRLRQWN